MRIAVIFLVVNLYIRSEPRVSDLIQNIKYIYGSEFIDTIIKIINRCEYTEIASEISAFKLKNNIKGIPIKD